MVTINLGEEGLRYLRTLLRGGDHLAAALFRLPLSEGKVWTYLPADVVNAGEISLDWGSPQISNSPESVGKPIVDLIVKYLSTDHSVFLLELESLSLGLVGNIFDRLSTRYFTAKPSKRTLIDSDGMEIRDVVGVYGHIQSGKVTRKQVSSLLTNRRPFGSGGVLSRAGGELPFVKGEETCDLEVFDRVAAQTEYILGTAYDDEGWIVWSRVPPIENR